MTAKRIKAFFAKAWRWLTGSYCEVCFEVCERPRKISCYGGWDTLQCCDECYTRFSCR